MSTSTPSVRTPLFGDRLMDALKAHQGSVLLSDSDGGLNAGEIEERVLELANRLRRAGCGPESLVALQFDPGLQSILAILAVQVAGSAYLPLDPRHGQDRLDQILATTTPDFHLKASGLICLAPGHTAEPSRGLNDLAYVISTSGSTGTPKAAMLEQRGLTIHTQAMIDLLSLGPDDVVLQTAPPSFDIAVWQCTTPIIAGSRTHVASDRERVDPRALWRVLIDQQVTVTQLVPSMLRVMLDSAPDQSELALRHVISTGEALDAQLAERWFAQYPDLPLINMYGPAECTDDVSVHVLRSGDALTTPLPIGRAFAGATLRVIDETGAPVRDGEVGELQVCGDIVGRGYRNDAARTAASFGSAAVDGKILRSYLTGDLVFRDPKGLLRYVGRRDFQVKVRGNRVELGEIEHLLASSDHVRMCVVTQLKDGTDRLVAHVEAEPGVDRSLLKTQAKTAFPSYMVPSAFVLHDQLPLNANGKVDRQRLPQPTSDDLVVVGGSTRCARTPTEHVVLDNWCALLDLPSIPLDADFFDLGGTSLLAVISLDELSRELDYEVPTGVLIQGGTVEAVAALIDEGRASTTMLNASRMGLVQLQESDSGTPLFLYPGEAASGLGMVDLGRRIAPGRSIYVFEPCRPLPGAAAPSMAELAARCNEAIERVEPDGPVHVGGFCMGGDVAWEIAHQRDIAGQQTASVVLLQTERDGVYPAWPANVGPLRRLAAKAAQRARFELYTSRNLGPVQRRRHLRHLVVGKLFAKATLGAEARLHSGPLAAKLGLRPSMRLRQELWARSDRQAYDGWTPATLECPTVVVRATEQPPLVEADPTLGWSSTGSPSMTATSVEGFHWSILHPPSVLELADVLSHELQRTDP